MNWPWSIQFLTCPLRFLYLPFSWGSWSVMRVSTVWERRWAHSWQHSSMGICWVIPSSLVFGYCHLFLTSHFYSTLKPSPWRTLSSWLQRLALRQFWATLRTHKCLMSSMVLQECLRPTLFRDIWPPLQKYEVHEHSIPLFILVILYIALSNRNTMWTTNATHIYNLKFFSNHTKK